MIGNYNLLCLDFIYFCKIYEPLCILVFVFELMLSLNTLLLVLVYLLVVSIFSGHGSFSNNPKLNSVVGHILHSSILVPYHGWYALDEFTIISPLDYTIYRTIV